MIDYVLIKKVSKKGYEYYSLRVYFVLNGTKLHKDYVLPFENNYAMLEVLKTIAVSSDSVE